MLCSRRAERRVTDFWPIKGDELCKLEIDGVPPSDNLVYRTGNSRNRFALYLSDKGSQWKQLVSFYAMSSGLKPTAEPVALKIEIYFPDRRKRDVQNYLKLTCDALQGHLYFDDCQISKLTLEKKAGPAKTIIKWK